VQGDLNMFSGNKLNHWDGPALILVYFVKGQLFRSILRSVNNLVKALYWSAN